MSGPSREAIEATQETYGTYGSAAVRKAYPIIRRDVAREIAERLREAARRGTSVGWGEWAVQIIGREFGGDDG